MKVAWHEMPGRSAKMIRPVGNGVIAGLELSARSARPGRNPSYRALRDGPFLCRVARHFMPGYRHLVPPGRFGDLPDAWHGTSSRFECVGFITTSLAPCRHVT